MVIKKESWGFRRWLCWRSALGNLGCSKMSTKQKSVNRSLSWDKRSESFNVRPFSSDSVGYSPPEKERKSLAEFKVEFCVLRSATVPSALWNILFFFPLTQSGFWTLQTKRGKKHIHWWHNKVATEASLSRLYVAGFFISQMSPAIPLSKKDWIRTTGLWSIMQYLMYFISRI